MLYLADIIVIWTLRIAILSLTLLAFIYFKRKRNTIPAVILLGMIFLSVGEISNYFANLILLQKENFRRLESITSVTGYFIILGYMVAVIGCYFNVLKKKS